MDRRLRERAEAAGEDFLSRFPRLASEGYGADWEYAGWLVWMLAHTDTDELPYAFSDWDSPEDRLLTTG